MKNNFIKQTIDHYTKYFKVKRKDNSSEEMQTAMKIYLYDCWITDEGGCHGTEYSRVYVLSLRPDLPHELGDLDTLYSFGTTGKTEIELKGQIALTKKEAEELSCLEKEAMRKELYRRFGMTNLKKEGNIWGPFFNFVEVYNHLKGKADADKT